ncbi:hypothetical protein ACFQZV_07575 [Microbacterium koreense]|uniref:Mannosyltransferase PIG-V n=1 Tax=Microbacterium koreense TaxID=323761 RepID=A0ABW2ZRP8_9MICO
MVELTDGPASRAVTHGWRATPVVARIAIVYIVSRLVTTGLLALAATLSGPQSRFGEDATIGTFALGWDAQWYWFVAVHGYPAELPTNEAGQVTENQWAFMPIYAYLAQWIGTPLGSWGAGAVIISLVAGFFSCWVLFTLLRPRIGDIAAMWSVVFFASAPLAALFHVGYAESLFLLWLFLALWAVDRRRYAWLYLLIPLMGYTRPGILAFALFLALHGIHRWVIRRREPLRVGEGVHIVITGFFAVAIGFSWQILAAWVTRDPDAYLATELAWRRNWIPDAQAGFVPGEGFVSASAFWASAWGMPEWAGYAGLALLIVGATAVLLFEPHVRRLGTDIRFWSASYLVYLLLVFFPQSSIFRLLVPLAPLWGAMAQPRSPWWRGGVLAACLLGQWWWIFHMYAVASEYWQIP